MNARTALLVAFGLLPFLSACGTVGAGGGGWGAGQRAGREDEAPPRRTPPPQQQERPSTLTPTLPLSAAFTENRGRLPWPADGTVTGLYGPRTDPEYGTRTFAPGIDLSTAPGTEVRAIFGGTVARVGAMAAYGTYVMVAHGGFTTVYGNLSAINVAAGDTVEVGQTVGLSGTADERRGAGLFFALFQGEEAVDPLGWLAPR